MLDLSRRLTQKVKGLISLLGWMPEPFEPGHYYSPIPSQRDLRLRQDTIWSEIIQSPLGIDLRTEDQLQLLETLSSFYTEQPWSDGTKKTCRYYFDNEYYGYSDAIFLYCMLRFLQPSRVIEIGSGFSSAAILDVNDHFLASKISLTCIEPDTARVRSLMQEGDEHHCEIIEKRLQDVEPSFFSTLRGNDVLFIDSTHVLKTDSDVNHILFEILPRLQENVHIHFHDIFYPFEYPKAWLFEGRYWNETYALKAFLQYNHTFEIVLFNTYLEHYNDAWFRANMPLCLKNRGGSIWLKKKR
jgi:predicted O-methyltransferase YrrM